MGCLNMSDIAISPEKLRSLAVAICRAAGSADEEARVVAENLVDANLTGHDSHGVGMLPIYIDAVRRGVLKLGMKPKVVSETVATLVVDGQHGYGQTIMKAATELLCAKAKEAGAAVLALRGTHHIGRIGAWAEQVAEHGLASFFVVDVAGVDAKVAPHGGREGRLGTNPICLGIPVKGGKPIIADMATSRIAVGKVRVAFNKGVMVDPGSLIDAAGNPTTDPGVMFAPGGPTGALLTMAAHKGYALSALAELFSGALGGGGTIASLPPETQRITNNAIAVAIDPSALGTADYIAGEAARLETWLKSSPGDVLLPGEPERRSRDARARSIPIDAGNWAQLADLARSLGLDPDSYLRG
ncbi:MAG: malate/lactate/ureidoglycolate dehydrogenase [Alphaproteobacteria bacterium]|nr:malate/lactate/ureidoglycolate dehydrogenase [Alphaproteobacteria bacterium]